MGEASGLCSQIYFGGVGFSLDHRGWKAAPTENKQKLRFTVDRFTVHGWKSTTGSQLLRFTVAKGNASVEPLNL
jgi:hypothetical protein